MNRDLANAYKGVYQAYAWHQGYQDAPVKFRIPDENFDPEPFNVDEFMAVVAETDDVGIHYWRLARGPVTSYGGDWFLSLACTEDNSMIDEAEGAFDDWLTAHAWLDPNIPNPPVIQEQTEAGR